MSLAHIGGGGGRNEEASLKMHPSRWFFKKKEVRRCNQYPYSGQISKSTCSDSRVMLFSRLEISTSLNFAE